MENHLNITSQFVPYELAVKLKELGFDEECFGYYRIDEKFVALTNYHENYNDSDSRISAPLWQQAFDWFRDKYRYSSIIPFNGSDHYYWWITECNSFGLDINSIDTHDFTTYEQARYSCLETLIQLIQNKNDRSI